MRFVRENKISYIMFIKNIDAECECGFLPANHVHCAYMEYRKLSPLEQLKILYSK